MIPEIFMSGFVALKPAWRSFFADIFVVIVCLVAFMAYNWINHRFTAKARPFAEPEEEK